MVTASLSMANSGLAPSERKKREIAKLIQLRGAGWTQQEVADEIGKSRQWVQGKLKEIIVKTKNVDLNENRKSLKKPKLMSTQCHVRVSYYIYN